MAVVEDLDEAERYLFALMQDASGIDMAEFMWKDETTHDSLFRCYDFQYPWYRDTTQFQIDQSARSVGKSLGIQMRAFAFAFHSPGEEMLLTAPELIHLNPITEKVEERILSCRVSMEMLRTRGASNGITHRPFEAKFVNGARLVGRIPQKDGKGVKGQHPKVLEQDESQDYPEAGWVELGETLKYGNKDAIWRAHGVSKGVRDRFYKQSQPGSGWKVHRITAMHRPDWTKEEREAKAELYGSRDHPDYRRNILGLHGDAQSALFVLARLMACVDSIQSSEYNEREYHNVRITEEKYRDSGLPIEALLNLPGAHKSYGVTWAGMDIGLTNHPSEILVFGETSQTRSGKNRNPQTSVLKLLTRVHMQRISAPDQRKVMEAIYDHYRCRAFSMDRTGLGFPIYQEIMADGGAGFQNSIRPYNFSEKIMVGYEREEERDESQWWEDEEREPIMANVLEYSSDMLRLLVDTGRIHLPYDVDLIREFQGQTYCTDDQTEILTQRGWLTCDEVRPGDLTLGVEDVGGELAAKWEVIEDVNVFPSVPRELMHMDGQAHSSVTTMNHRWLTKPYNHAKYHQFVTSEDLESDDRRHRIPLGAKVSNLPTTPAYSDDLVELVAWYWTEGYLSNGKALGIAQSWSANPGNCERIQALLSRMLGDGAESPGTWNHGMPWSSNRKNGNFAVLDPAICNQVRAVMDDEKVVKPEFLASLTEEQLRLFVDVSILGDGCEFTREREGKSPTEVRTFIQCHRGRAKMFEFACALLGQPTHTQEMAEERYVVTLLTRRYAHSTSLNRVRKVEECRVWCPTTGTGTWLARHKGSIHFTGNTISKSTTNPYGRKVFSAGKYHALDAARMAALGFFQEQVGALQARELEPVMDSFVMMG